MLSILSLYHKQNDVYRFLVRSFSYALTNFDIQNLQTIIYFSPARKGKQGQGLLTKETGYKYALKEEIHKKNNNIIRGPLIVLSFTDTQFLISAARDFFPRTFVQNPAKKKNEQFIGSFLSNWN